MACYTRLYGVDLAELRSFFGSADQARLQRLVESKMEDIEENDRRFEDKIEIAAEDDNGFEDDIEDAGWPMTIDAIAEILMGKCIDGNHNAMYGYALEIICDHLGKRLNDDELGPLGNHPYRSRLLESRSPVPIPLSDDVPVIGYLEPQEVDAELKAVDACGLRSGDEIAQDVQIFRDALENASGKRLAVVSFCY